MTSNPEELRNTFSDLLKLRNLDCIYGDHVLKCGKIFRISIEKIFHEEYTLEVSNIFFVKEFLIDRFNNAFEISIKRLTYNQVMNIIDKLKLTHIIYREY